MTTLKNAIYQNVIESLKEFGYLDVNEKTIFTNLEYRNFFKTYLYAISNEPLLMDEESKSIIDEIVKAIDTYE